MSVHLSTKKEAYKNEIFAEIEDLKNSELERILRLIRLEKWRGVKFATLKKGQKPLTSSELEAIRHEDR